MSIFPRPLQLTVLIAGFILVIAAAGAAHAEIVTVDFDDFTPSNSDQIQPAADYRYASSGMLMINARLLDRGVDPYPSINQWTVAVNAPAGTFELTFVNPIDLSPRSVDFFRATIADGNFDDDVGQVTAFDIDGTEVFDLFVKRSTPGIFLESDSKLSIIFS